MLLGAVIPRLPIYCTARMKLDFDPEWKVTERNIESYDNSVPEDVHKY